jgi:hypothetical protein
MARQLTARGRRRKQAEIAFAIPRPNSFVCLVARAGPTSTRPGASSCRRMYLCLQDTLIIDLDRWNV